jgi:hypothetical protein
MLAFVDVFIEPYSIIAMEYGSCFLTNTFQPVNSGYDALSEPSGFMSV